MKKKRIRQNLCRGSMPKFLLKMKLLSFFILVSAITTIAGNSYSQQAKFNILSRNVTVREVLQKIEESSEFIFLYSEKSVDVDRKVDVNVSNQTVDVVLDQLFNGTKNYYEIKNRQIAILEKGSVEIPSGTQNRSKSEQKPLSITGKVIDSSGGSLPGVSVVVKGTTTGTITDANGKYSLNNIPANATLQFSFVGMKLQEVVVGTKTSINVTLEDETIGLEEVVAVGYGTVKKSDMTGAIASVSSKELVRGGRNNAILAMQGSVSGVNIIRSNNKPGGGLSMDIRGLHSISKSNTPLVVIDGIPGADLTLINPEDIEKIDILKDASATSIYGSRGANGVIMVTTKRGVEGEPVITYNGYFGLKSATNMPEMMSGDEWVQMVRESVRAKNNNVYKTDEQIFTDPSELQAVKDHNYYDWTKALRKTGIQTSHTISATGGTNKSQYSVSAGYYDEKGLIAPEEYTKYNLKANIDLKANDFIGVGASMYLIYSMQNQGNNALFQDIYRARQTQHPYSLVTGELTKKFSSNGIFNPFVTQPNSIEKYKVTNILGSVYTKITPIKGLEIKSTFSPFLTNQTYGQFNDTWSKALQGTALPTAQMRNTGTYNWVFDNIGNYKISEGIHKVDITGVFSMQQYQSEQLYGNVKNLGFNSQWYNLGGGVVNSLTSNFSKNSMVSYLGRVNYSYKDKYLFTASGRYDGSSKLAPGHKWAFFPSAAIAWRLIEEPFMKRFTPVSNLKLRVSYGETGNDSVDPYSTSANISSPTYYMFGSTVANGNTPGSLGNASLTWEQTREINLGMDIGLFNNRITGTIEYYNRLTSDLIMNKLIATHSGYSSVAANVGSTRNRGIEFTFNTENFST